MDLLDISSESENRTKRLLESIVTVSWGSDLDATLRRVLQVAVDLVRARYGEVGILPRAGHGQRFISVGLDGGPGRWIAPSSTTGGVTLLDVDDPGRPGVDGVDEPPTPGATAPGSSPPLTSLDATIRWEEEVLGKLYLAEKEDGQQFTADDEITVTAVADAVGMSLHYGTEIEQARKGRQWLEAAGDVSTELLADGDSERALGVIAARALELSASDTAIVLLPSDAGLDQAFVTDLRIAVCVGAGADILLDLVIPAAGSTSGAVMADGTPRRVDATHRRAGIPIAFGPAMAVPLTSGHLNSVLMVFRAPESRLFDDDDLTRLTFFADNAALAIHLAETQRLRELRVLAERDRLARELYDHVLQQLFAVGLAMQVTRGRSRSSSDARMEQHIEQVQSVIREVRQAMFDLPLPRVNSPRVRTTIAQMITSLTVDSPQAVHLRMTGTLDDLPADLAECARAVLREAVGSAVRRADADLITITVTVDDELVVDVRHNGTGVGESTELTGLAGLQQLAIDMAGSVTVDRPATGGTHLVWAAPLP